MAADPTLLNALPIDSVIPRLEEKFDTSLNLVLQAPPGAGKTTRVPLALLDRPWLAGQRIIVLEPRRLAARAAARRMAALRGEVVGDTVGYRMRMDTKVGPKTRIEVVTDGVFVRMLQQDPALDGIGLVVFDEIHERSLDGDLNLALCLEVQGALRRDLRLLAMSATLDGAAVARLLGDAPVLTSDGRSFPVETVHLDRPAAGAVEDAVAAAVRRALAETGGDILVFLPGAAEIRRVQARLDDLSEVRVAPLFGELAQAEQDAALDPTRDGRRRVVLATAIAETSLTIEGITVVIDSGLMRLPRFEARTGMSGLETVRVSQASADQRRGRAGRLGPGRCYRLWPEAEQRGLAPFTPPEMLAADLAPLALELAQWGADPGQLAWLDPPPAAAFEQARTTLRALGALGTDDRITPHGRDMARFGVHPRLAHMMLAGHALGEGRLAGALAAILSERDVVKARPGTRDADLRLRVDLLTARGERDQLPNGLLVDRGALQRARQAMRSWQRQLGTNDVGGKEGAVNGERTGLLVALAYPDRVAQRRGGRTDGGHFVLANGRGARLPATDPLAAADWLAIADLDAGRQDAQIFHAAPLTLAEIEDAFADQVTAGERIEWDAREGAVLARRQRRLGRLVLKDEPLAKPPRDAVAAALLDGIRAAGLDCLPWTKDLAQWRARVAFVRRLELPPRDWPDLSDDALAADLAWLAPYLDGMTRLAHLRALDLGAALRARLDWAHQKALEAAAPTHVVVPSGSRLPIDYESGEVPMLAVRLQEMFGLTQTPTVADGRVPVLLHLLSPASRPVQVTRDLASFWATGYRAVKADLKGQYPKHYWPDDPLQAQPTNRTKKRMGL